MTRVFGHLFSDDRSGILAVQPSKPFFGCGRHERHFEVIDGAIDLILDPTPAGVHYMVGYKQDGDTRRTDFTIKWRVPNTPEFDVSPGADNSIKPPNQVLQSSTVYERVQLKRVAGELSETLVSNQQLRSQLAAAELRVKQLEDELRAYQRTTDLVLSDRDETISQLQEQTAPVVRTVYRDKPVPPEALYERLKRLEQENMRLVELNSEYYKSVVELYQLQLDKARSGLQEQPVDQNSSPQQRLLRKLLGK